MRRKGAAPRFTDYIHVFDFGSLLGVALPGKSHGFVQRLDHWGSFSIGSISMGQEVGVTPLQMINAVSAIANGGLHYRPQIGFAPPPGLQLGGGPKAAPRRVGRGTPGAANPATPVGGVPHVTRPTARSE